MQINEKIDRNIKIYEEYLTGTSINQLAMKYQLNPKTIWVILMRHKRRSTAQNLSKNA